MVEDTDIGLGYRVRDTISGYEGIVTDIGTHLTGCTRFGVMPDSHEDPTRRGDTEFFYGAQLEILSEDTDYAEDAEDSITEVDFDLGDVVEDDVTGFRGVASTITYNLYNCPRVAVQPQVGSDTILPGGDSENDIDREEQFKATDVDVNTYDGDVSIRLNFRGFEGYEPAVDKVTGVASTFEEHPEVDEVELNASTSGMYDPEADEHDERPAGWVSAKIEG